MSLVQCPECKQEISTQATTCPHCGAPQRATAGAPASVMSAPASKRFPLWALALGLGVLVVGAVFLLQGRRAHGASDGAPAARWIIDNVDANEECTVLGEYCVRVRCAITNAGSAAGMAHVAADLAEDSVVVATRRGTRSVEVGAQDTLTLDFPEANMGKNHSFRCYPIE